MKKEISLALLLGSLLMTPPLLAQQAQRPAAGGPDLVGALKAVPGCLGVETARTATGKQVIFAWFENKKALLDWSLQPGAPAVDGAVLSWSHTQNADARCR